MCVSLAMHYRRYFLSCCGCVSQSHTGYDVVAMPMAICMDESESPESVSQMNLPNIPAMPAEVDKI